MRRSRAVAAAVLALAVAGCGGSSGTQGADLYDQVCSACHGAGGVGGVGPALGAGSNAETLTDEQIAGAIAVGPGAMPGFGHLSDDQIASLVEYIRSLQE